MPSFANNKGGRAYGQSASDGATTITIESPLLKIDKVVFYFNENNGNPEGSHVEKLTINCPSEHTINLTATDLTATWQSESANTGTYSFTFSDTGNSNVIINHIDVSYKPLGEDDNYTYDATVVNDGKTGKFILTGETAATLTAGSKIKDIPGIELTFGKAGDSNWSVEYNNTNYANKAKAGSTESVTLTDGVPTGGSFFVFKPLVNGFLTVDGTFYRAHNIVLTNSSGTYRQTIRETSDNYDDKYSEHSFTKVLTAGETYYLYEDGNWQFKLRGFSFTPAFILSSEDYAATEEITCYYNLSGFNVFPRLTNKKAVDGVAYTSSITSVATVEATTDNVTLKSNVGNPVISASITRGDLTLNTSYTIHNQYNESAFKVQGKSLKPSEVFDESGATNTSVNVRKQIGDIGFTFGGCDWAESYEQINTGKTSKVVSDKYSDSKDDSTGALDGFAYFMAGNNNPKDELCYNWSEGGNAVVFDQRFNIPCRGTFYKFQPKADGNLTVYVQQNGCTNTTTDSDNKVVFNPTSISYRPLYIMDEQTNFVMLIDMKTNAILPNAASDVVRENIEADVEKKYFDMIKAYWASQGLNSQAEFLKLKDDDKHNVKDSYNGEEVNVKPVTAPHLADGLILITGGMSMFKFHVQAGKTYFMFGQRTKLGISGFVFEKDAYDYSSRPTVELSQTASSFSLTDDQKAHEVKVKLSGRTIKPNVWQPICLPFSMNEQQVIDYFGEGTQVYHFDNTHDNRLHLRKHIYQYIIAGIPCFIRTTKEFKGDETVIEHVTLEKDTPTDIKGRDKDMDENKDIVDIAASEYMLKGNFTQTTINTDDEYYISNGAFYRAATQSYSLYGYRCKVVPVGGSGSAKFLSNETLFEDFMQELGEVTGINEIQSSPHGDKDAIYSLDGQKISSSAHGLDSLHKGIYIVNGKKYVVK